MLRTAEERASLLRDWQADPRNRGRQPPVEVVAPGTKAPKKPTAAQKAEVQALLRQEVEDLKRLELKHMRMLLPVFQQAEKEMAAQLADWVHRTPDGELRFSAWKYRSALVQLHAGVGHLSGALGEQLERGGHEAQKLALTHLEHEVARLSSVFGDHVAPLQWNLAKIMASGESALVPRFRNSAARYSGNVWGDIKQRLAVEILKGSSVSEMVDRLVEQRGPSGYVSLSGVAGDEGAIVEHIPEGLFVRYRWWAERVVRTELGSAYGVQMLQGLHAAKGVLPDLQKRWCTDGSGCAHICTPADGQTIDLHEVFVLGDGSTTDTAPGHPNCRCRVGAWRAHWGELLDSMGID